MQLLIENNMESKLQQYKQVLFRTMKTFHNFCVEHDINYYGCSGTAIGAVRHQGCIPWDDDIDVLIPRKDYEKLLSLKDQFPALGYEIVNHTDNGYPLPFAKFCDANTTLWERKEYPFIEGVYIDLFPLDESPYDIELADSRVRRYKRLFRKYEYSLSSFSFADLWSALVKKDIRLTGHILLCWFRYRWFRKSYYKIFLEYDHEMQQIRGDRLIHYFCSYRVEKELFRKEWFKTYAEMPYEDFKIRIPGEYDSYLRQLFGDYMKLPPVEHRKSYHKHYFLDLEKRLCLSEVKEIIKKS